MHFLQSIPEVIAAMFQWAVVLEEPVSPFVFNLAGMVDILDDRLLRSRLTRDNEWYGNRPAHCQFLVCRQFANRLFIAESDSGINLCGTPGRQVRSQK